MYYGVQYYPEHWPEDRWPVDARMMAEAGVNGVRIGEFAWSFYEPRPGRVDFSAMDRALDVLHEAGITAIMCTCGRTVPPWFYAKYPGEVNVFSDGRTENPKDSRYRIGLLHEDFADEARRIDEAVVEHFAGHPAIRGWQVDNEIGSANDCWCDRCLDAFREYLRRKYGTPEALNRAWGSHFWSYNIGDFDEVQRPHDHFQAQLEYRRFMSEVNVDFVRDRVEMIHRLDPGQWVTTNCQALGARHTDWNDVCEVVDLAGFNHYPARTPQLAIDLYRGQRTGLIALEQFTRLQHVDAGPGWMRLWAWMTVAHGATGINFFRWRQCRWGREQFADGLLPHSGKANRLYDELARMGDEVKRIGALVDRTQVRARAALLVDYPSRWAVDTGLYRDMDPAYEAADYHDALRRLNHSTDAVNPRKPLERYRLVIAPRLWIVDDAIARNLGGYVEAGGILVLTAGSGVTDEFGVSFDTPRPGPLAEPAGIEVSDLAWSDAHSETLDSDAIPGLNGTVARAPWDEIHVAGAEVLARYAEGWRAGMPAVTRNRFGEGQVVYVGARLEQPGLDALVTWLCAEAKLEPLLDTPAGVRAYERRGDDVRLLFLLNYNEEPRRVDVPGAWTDALTGEPVDAAEIAAVDLRILREA